MSPQCFVPNPVTGHHNAPCGSCFARLPFFTLLQEIENRGAAKPPPTPLFPVLSRMSRVHHEDCPAFSPTGACFVPPIAQWSWPSRNRGRNLTCQYPAG